MGQFHNYMPLQNIANPIYVIRVSMTRGVSHMSLTMTYSGSCKFAMASKKLSL
jgi:hypothetical protein